MFCIKTFTYVNTVPVSYTHLDVYKRQQYKFGDGVYKQPD